MKKIMLISAINFFLICFSLISLSQDIKLIQKNESGIYKKGERITLTAFVGSNKGDSISIRVLKNNNQVLQKKSFIIASDSLTLFDGSFGEPCSIIAEVKSKSATLSLGAIVDPEHLKPGAKIPSDFKAYWDMQKKSLKALPFDVKTAPVADYKIDPGYSCVNIELNCLGPKPARGYFAKPERAAPKSLPIVLLVHAVPYRPHHQPEGALAKTWEDDFHKPREQFISNYLK